MVDEEAKLRDYQLELYHEIVERRSCILFLPTGSGKTHIAFWLIKSMAADFKKPVTEGGKRTFFLVNTVQLVQQQASLLMKLGNFKVICLSGAQGVDSFKGDRWSNLENEYGVFVMTTQVYLDALNSSFVSLENANLLVLDECHRATGHHPMAEILRLVNKCSVDKKPKILGLSATLLNANLKKAKQSDLAKKLIELEAIFDGKIIVAKNCQEIRERFSAKPNEEIRNLSKYHVDENTKTTLERLRDQSLKCLGVVKLKDNIVLDSEEQNDIQLHKPGLNRSKLLQNVLKDTLVHVDEYGLYLGYMCCQCYIIQLYRYMFASCERRYINMILYIIHLAQMMRKVLYSSILKRANCKENDFRSSKTIESTSSEKIKCLFNLLLGLKSSDRCIVFVEKKMTAKSLYQIIKLFVAKQTDCGLVVDFIVGSDSNPLRNTREGLNDSRKQKEILGKFRNGFTHVLIATNVVEEGIDVQECNLVIMFDGVKSFRSYVQSKGRARMKDSMYIVLSDEAKPINSKISGFRDIDRQLDRIINQKDILDDDSGYSEILFDEYVTPTGAKATNISAVSKIYQYCSILPRDLFTDLIPYWFYNLPSGTCKLKLPANAGVRIEIRGSARPNRKEAKQAAALEGVRKLHEKGLLDDHLLPIRIPKEALDTEFWFPNWDAEDDEEQKRMKSKRDNRVLDNTFTSLMRVPESFVRSRPLPYTKCYLHVIRTETVYEEPTVQRLQICHELMRTNEHFGILTREPFPPICEFPTYTDLGEVRVRIEVNDRIFKFNEEELSAISKFHRTLLLDILKVVPTCFVFDADEDSNGFYIVPVIPKIGVPTELSWECIRRDFEDVREPSDEERMSQEYTSEKYFRSVVTPWYRTRPRYIVCDMPSGMNLQSEFNDKYPTYAEYFLKKYDLTPLRPEQPLLCVRAITKNLDGIVPKPISMSQKNRRKMKDQETYLPPELCYLFSFPAVFWYKAIILPSVLHRMYYLLMSDDLRRRIVNEAGLGSLELPPSDEDTVPHFKMVAKNKAENAETTSSRAENNVIKRSADRDANEIRKPKRKKVDHDSRIKDLDREIDVKVVDIKRYTEYFENASGSGIKNELQNQGQGSVSPNGPVQERPFKYVLEFIESPELMTLKKHQVEYGPKPHEILEALTLRIADDALHLERLETLGDSVLKYLVSISTFLECAEMNEGHLTYLKGRLVSNQNLFYCAQKLNIASYIKATVFSAKNSWSPPGFSILRALVERLNGDSISALSAAKLLREEQFSGNVTEETIERVLKTDIEDFIKNKKGKDEGGEKRIRFYLGEQQLRRKNVSDVMEALLGVYLKTCGLSGVFKLLKYYGIPCKAANLEELYSGVPSPLVPNDLSVCSGEGFVENLLPDYKSIENLLNYEFKDKYFLLQAFTHPSYTGNIVTACYQKLEFIGDAVLDFLVTSYIYEYCGNLNPGQLTDLRSSLVNNTTFGALVVRLQLHRYLLYHSQTLAEAMHSFVIYQEEKNYEIHGNELVRLITENDASVAEEVDVPKALGDVFESVAGAIFLDSGCNPAAVWNVYYSIMKDEIEKFSERIPINPVRALYEKAMEDGSTQVSFCAMNSTLPPGMEHLKEKFKIVLKITSSKESKEYMGRGYTKKTAMRAAAKFALRDLNYNEFVI